jgi:hypothetical protein
MKRKIIFILFITIIFLIWLFMIFNKKKISEISTDENISHLNQNSNFQVVLQEEENLRRVIETNDKKIDFYGKVLDIDGKFLRDVEVSWDLLKSGSFEPSLGLPTGSSGITKTDSAGRFSVLNESGITIRVNSLTYPGYHNIDIAPRSFGYRNAEPHQPDPTAPVSFVMIKDGGKRSLVFNESLKFDWDGGSKKISLGPSELLNQIILIPSRKPLIPGERVHEWKLVIKAQEGQLILGKNDGISLAPTSGYLDEIVLESDKGGQWGGKAEALLYLKTNAQTYAEIRLSAYSDRSSENSATGYVDIRWNPDGERAFE